MADTGIRGGTIVLFGSGETSPSGRKVHDAVMSALKAPVRVAILETPAGFQPNSELVAGKLGEFIQHNLQNHKPSIDIVAARRKDGAHSTDDAELLQPMLSADYIFLGPGSPTYAVRQLKDSLAYRYLVQRHLQGVPLVLASAAAFAISAKVLPVYEMFKVGQDPHWVDGLDLFGMYGLEVAIVPHWNNAEGGEELDTSHGFVGLDRFAALRELLPPSTRILGIDEHTAAVVDFSSGCCRVMGKGGVTLCHGDADRTFASGESFDLSLLGAWRAAAPPAGWQAAPAGEAPPDELPSGAAELLERRRRARKNREWGLSDALRDQLSALGVKVEDTREGQRWEIQSGQM